MISSPKIELHIQNVFVEGRGQLLLVKIIPAMLLLHISHLYYYYLFYLFCKNKNKVIEDERDPKFLTDGDLKAALLRHGITAGPIVGEGTTIYGALLKTHFFNTCNICTLNYFC